MLKNKGSLFCITHSLLQQEIEVILHKGIFNFNLCLLDSFQMERGIHLYDYLREFLIEGCKKGNRYFFLLGNQYSGFEALAEELKIPWANGENPYEFLLGNDAYQKARTENALILMTEHLEEFFYYQKSRKGFNVPDGFRKILFLDNGSVEVPYEILYRIAYKSDLPFEVRTVSLNNLMAVIQEILPRIPKPDRGRKVVSA